MINWEKDESQLYIQHPLHTNTDEQNYNKKRKKKKEIIESRKRQNVIQNPTPRNNNKTNKKILHQRSLLYLR